MSDDTIVFQFATHYLTKIALRLEGLFLAIEQACIETNPIIHHYALKNLIDIIKIIEKPELKSRFIKELIRIEHAITKSPMSISDAGYARLFVQVQVLNHMAGSFGGAIHKDLFLQSIRLAQSGQAGDCELQAPLLSFWLENDFKIRQLNLINWTKSLKTLSDTVHILLDLLRDLASFETIDLKQGFYQRTLPAKMVCQLVMLRMDKKLGIVPKMQWGHHGLSLSFNDAYSMQEVKPDQMRIELAISQL